MAYGPIRSELTRIGPSLAAGVRQQHEIARQIPDLDVQALVGFEASRQTKALAELLALQPEFAPDRLRTLVTGGTWIPLQLELVAEQAALISLERGEDATIAWLEKIAAVSSARVRLVFEVAGIEPPQAVTKVAGFSVQAFGSLPDTRTAQLARRAYTSVPYAPLPNPPDVALVATVDVQVAPLDVTDLAPFMAGLQAAAEEMHAALNLMTAVGGGAPIVLRGWSELEDSDLARFQAGFGWQSPPEIARPATKVALDSEAIEFVAAGLRLKGDFGRRIARACRHLSLARRRADLGERATEVSICLESLLGDTERFDLTYKLGVRAGLLIGGSLRERLATSELVTDLYRLRGQVVHGKTVQRSEADLSLVQSVADLAGALVRQLVADGGAPHWRSLELSGGLEKARPSDVA